MPAADGADRKATFVADPGVPSAVPSRPPRKPRPVTKESPIAFRGRPGTRARLAKRAGNRALSVVVEAAVDAYLGRKVVDVDPTLRAALSEELAAIADRLAEIEHQEVGIGRNRNQLQLFVNRYRELPVTIAVEMSEENRLHEAVLAELAAIRDRLDHLIDASAVAA
ncbi:hypothetical protein A5766_02430 [Gordonia sp. 852002-51296_SCH5728562-b]|nr:hypothetical protein A5766_02430 [Gordonia sp. 852002-51296_SCH5728562-b]